MTDVSSVLTEVLLKATLQPILISSKMAMEHMMVIALLHSTVGTEIGEIKMRENKLISFTLFILRSLFYRKTNEEVCAIAQW